MWLYLIHLWGLGEAREEGGKGCAEVEGRGKGVELASVGDACFVFSFFLKGQFLYVCLCGSGGGRRRE